ncbi:four-carbon acid sugar kinase family protein [[Eubacterium] cellulosolvens]
MAKLGVIADDLTGANDTGVQFSKQGLKTIVLAKTDSLVELSKQADVIVLDTESRALAKQDAYERVKEAANRLVEAKISIIYKKIDSTLKGNIGAEIDAVMDATGIKPAIVVSAFPANRRITVGGYQLVNQIPLGKTEASRDPVTPVTESHVPTIIAAQSKRRVEHIDLRTTMDGDMLKAALVDKAGKDKEIIVLDAIVQSDLKRIANTLAQLGLHKLTCGPAGLAEEMPEALGLISGSPVIVISGSLSEVNMRQISNASKSGTLVLNLNNDKIIENEKEQEIKRICEETKRIINSGKDVIISSALTKNMIIRDLERGKTLGLSSAEMGKIISSVLGEIANEVSTIPNISGLILTGGTIAIRTLEAMGSFGTEVDDEVSPGIPSAIVKGGPRSGLRIVTKAGAFGDEEAITRSIKYLKKKNLRKKND